VSPPSLKRLEKVRKIKRRRKRYGVYTVGQANYLIDSTLHPFFNKHPVFIVADAALHYLVEQNPAESTVKFVKYTLPQVAGQIRRRKRRKSRA
jgi:hypothetical protein